MRQSSGFADPVGAMLALIEDDSGQSLPRGASLARRLRRLILDGVLAPGERLPASRTLAGHLGCARGTIEAAYGDLDAEGLIERRRGDGSFVTTALTRLERRKHSQAPAARDGGSAAGLSERGRALAGITRCPYPEADRSFSSGVPDARVFPWAEWRRLVAQCLQNDRQALAGYTSPQGLPRLRESLSRWLRLSRGISCTPDQVLVLHSSQQALSLSATLLFDSGDRVAVEDPGYPGAFAAFSAAGLKPVPVAVDDAGLETARLGRQSSLRGVCVTPSYQNPLGATLSLERRLDLIEWAARNGAWIIEDDYAGGLTYDHKPIAALAGLDSTGRTIYIGTCSKLVFPGLRLAWMVLPAALVPSFTTLRANLDGHSAALSQAVLAGFIDQGLLAKHIRKMALLYRRRRDVLVAQLSHLNREAGAAVFKIRIANAGLKLAVELRPPLQDTETAELAPREGPQLPTLSTTALAPESRRQGFILGFSGLDEAEITERVGRLRRVMAALPG